MSGLVLSLFPGVGLFDLAFQEEGFCVVRGPDLLWGGDIHRFHPPADRFEGVIGGPPCQKFSRLRRILPPEKEAPDLIPEFERCVAEAEPAWFVMENVPEAPLPEVEGYEVRDVLFRDHWVGGETMRQRRFSFGTRDGCSLHIEQLALYRPDPMPAITAHGSTWRPIRKGGSGKTKRGRIYGDKSAGWFEEAKRAQGLPEDWDLPPFKVREKCRAIGNGVPLSMGRAVAKAVRRAIEDGVADVPGRVTPSRRG